MISTVIILHLTGENLKQLDQDKIIEILDLDCRPVAKFKHQKKACFEAKAGPGKKSLAFLFIF
jgi:putative methionine-R-sulfoxide reductase with GAF domain